jgi:Tfp pilus assembly protein PilF
VGNDYQNLGEQARASEYFTKAFQLRERDSELEKLVITANYYQTVTGELYKAAQTYQEAIESYPRKFGLYNNLGTLLALLGQYEKAAEVTRSVSEYSEIVFQKYNGLCATWNHATTYSTKSDYSDTLLGKALCPIL